MTHLENFLLSTRLPPSLTRCPSSASFSHRLRLLVTPALLWVSASLANEKRVKGHVIRIDQ